MTEFCTECPDHEACATGWPCDLVRTQAEIKRLRGERNQAFAENEYLTAALNAANNALADLEAENARMRDALVRIRCAVHDPHLAGGAVFGVIDMQLDAALAGDQP